MTNPRAWAYSRNAALNPRIEGVGPVDDRLDVVRDDHLEHPAEKPPGRLEPGDHLLQGLAVGREDEHAPRVHRGKDQRVDHPASTAGRVGHQPEPAEIDLHLHPGITIGDPQRRAAPAEPALVHGEAVQRPIRHHHPAPTEQHVHLGQRQIPLQPGPDLVAVRVKGLPRSADPMRAVRAHHPDHRAEQLIGQLPRATLAQQPGVPRGLHIAAHGLAIGPSQHGHLAQRVTRQPQPKNLLHLDHEHLPVGHAATTTAARPEAGTPRRSPSPANRVVPSLASPWSHARGKTRSQLVPSSWQTTAKPRHRQYSGDRQHQGQASAAVRIRIARGAFRGANSSRVVRPESL
jgi:hypothetical protein